MDTTEAADLARIILDDTETDRHMDLYTLTVIEARALARAVLKGGDDAEARPWEPLNEDDPLNVGDEVKRVAFGATITAVVGRVDPEGDPWTAEDGFIGRRSYGTWYVRPAGLESDMP